MMDGGMPRRNIERERATTPRGGREGMYLEFSIAWPKRRRSPRCRWSAPSGTSPLRDLGKLGAKRPHRLPQSLPLATVEAHRGAGRWSPDWRIRTHRERPDARSQLGWRPASRRGFLLAVSLALRGGSSILFPLRCHCLPESSAECVGIAAAH